MKKQLFVFILRLIQLKLNHRKKKTDKILENTVMLINLD